MTLLLLLAACSRSPAPVEETESSVARDADTMTVVPTADMFSRSSGPIVLRHYFYDEDGDSYGVIGSGLWATRRPVGYVRLGGDCDDSLATVNPGATEDVTDGLDNDCNGTTDEVDADTADTADTAGSDSGTETATDSGVDTAGSDTGDTSTDTSVTASGILVSRDASDGLAYPADIYAWYGASTASTATVASASDTLVFSPTDVELSNHSWVDIQAAWSSGASWSDDCTGFTVTSDDYTVALYENTVSTGTSDTCRIYVGLAVPSGGDVGVWTLVP